MTTLTFSIPLSKCTKLVTYSYYNHTYYGLPFPVNNCDVLHNSYDGGEIWNGYSIGKIVDDQYIPQYWLHTDEDELIEFNSTFIKEYNQWT